MAREARGGKEKCRPPPRLDQAGVPCRDDGTGASHGLDDRQAETLVGRSLQEGHAGSVHPPQFVIGYVAEEIDAILDPQGIQQGRDMALVPAHGTQHPQSVVPAMAGCREGFQDPVEVLARFQGAYEDETGSALETGCRKDRELVAEVYDYGLAGQMRIEASHIPAGVLRYGENARGLTSGEGNEQGHEPAFHPAETLG